MAEFTKVAHEWVRMCKAYSHAGDCMKCPMVTNPICGCMSDDNGASDKEISKAEADIMSWAAEHPEPLYPVWRDWLRDLYGNPNMTMTDILESPIDPEIALRLNIIPKKVR